MKIKNAVKAEHLDYVVERLGNGVFSSTWTKIEIIVGLLGLVDEMNDRLKRLEEKIDE